jgi:hypothetical protein
MVNVSAWVRVWALWTATAAGAAPVRSLGSMVNEGVRAADVNVDRADHESVLPPIRTPDRDGPARLRDTSQCYGT